ncbi:hypothetical protein EHQ53_10725 [Leptospira langatensis]|uniref:TRL-like family protein n=1 Tax=Leptospira langatensis TaxID=2484983 RepID=A0A5F1ZU28_9LEPT|nr:hypothetical protein [Leptospira langatensis]TGJ98966.1 hypothetical protein EHO57_15775 [Leptospira langatensis]TGL40465.1 hypothetical protein EHQ53_10725 [Leptospira langatensis]
MKKVYSIFIALFLAQCSSGPISLTLPNTKTEKPANGKEVVISESSCGYHLLDFIPTSSNTTLYYAMRSIQLKTMDKYVAKITLEQDWYHGLIGTFLCSTVNATVIE